MSRCLRSRGSVVVALFALGLVLSACSGGGSDGNSSNASGATTTTATTVPTTLAGASDTCPSFRGATTTLTSDGPTAPAFLVDANAVAQGCLDVVTLIFNSRGDGTPPGYTVGYRDPAKDPFQDGDPPENIDLPGNAFLVISASPALSHDPTVDGNPSTYPGNLSLEYGDHHHLQIVRELPDGKTADGQQDTVNWVIGLDSVRPFRVDRAENPTRIMVLIG